MITRYVHLLVGWSERRQLVDSWILGWLAQVIGLSIGLVLNLLVDWLVHRTAGWRVGWLGKDNYYPHHERGCKHDSTLL